MNKKTIEINNKEKELIENLFSTLSRKPLVKTDDVLRHFVENKFNKLFELEAKKLGLKFSSDKNKTEKNDIDFFMQYLPDNKWLGNCTLNRNYDTKINEFYNEKTTITLNECCDSFDHLYSLNREDRLRACKQLLKTFFHEIRHYRQLELASLEQCDINVLNMAEEFTIFDILDSREFYEENHDSFVIEADADIYGYDYSSKFEEGIQFDHRDLSSKNVAKEFSKIKIKKQDGTYELFDRNEYVNNFIEYIITKKKLKDYLSKYPSISLEYNYDCSRKSITQLFNDRIERLIEINSEKRISDSEKKRLIETTNTFYNELFMKQLTKSGILELNELIKKNGIKNVANYLHELNEYNKQERRRKAHISLEHYENKVFADKNKIRYIESNGEYFELKNGKKTVLASSKSFTNSLQLNNKLLEQQIRKLIPVNNIYILNNGSKVLATQYLKNIIFDNLDSILVDKNILYQIIRSNVKSTIETEHILQLEKVNRELQLRKNTIDNTLDCIREIKVEKALHKLKAVGITRNKLSKRNKRYHVVSIRSSELVLNNNELNR